MKHPEQSNYRGIGLSEMIDSIEQNAFIDVMVN